MAKYNPSFGGLKTGYHQRSSLSVSINNKKNRDIYNKSNESKRYPNGLVPLVCFVIISIVVLFIALALNGGFTTYSKMPNWDQLYNYKGGPSYCADLQSSHPQNKSPYPDSMSDYHNYLMGFATPIETNNGIWMIDLNGDGKYDDAIDWNVGSQIHHNVFGQNWGDDFVYAAVVSDCLLVFWWLGRQSFASWARFGILKFNKQIKIRKLREKMQLYVITPALADVTTLEEFKMFEKKRATSTKKYFMWTCYGFLGFTIIAILLMIIMRFAVW